MDTKRALGQAIKRRRTAQRLTQPQLAEMTGGVIDQSSLSRIERGEQEPPNEKLFAIAQALRVKISELWDDAEHIEHISVGEPETRYDVSAAPGISYVPLISWVQAGHWSDPSDAYPRGTGEKLIATTARVGRLAYALRVRGDSMTNPRGDPTFPEGTVIIVDPQRQADSGSLVIARLVDEEESTFKRLSFDGQRRYLVPLNPQFPTMELDQETLMCGVVVAIAERELQSKA